jgi:hypothetical protein
MIAETLVVRWVGTFPRDLFPPSSVGPEDGSSMLLHNA